MDERVEIIDAPQPLQPHPSQGAAITRYAAADPSIWSVPYEAGAVKVPHGVVKFRWGIASLLSVLSATVSLKFFSDSQVLFWAWAGIIFVGASVICSLIAVKIDEPDAQTGSRSVAWISLLISLSVAILLMVAFFTSLIVTI